MNCFKLKDMWPKLVYWIQLSEKLKYTDVRKEILLTMQS